MRKNKLELLRNIFNISKKDTIESIDERLVCLILENSFSTEIKTK